MSESKSPEQLAHDWSLAYRYHTLALQRVSKEGFLAGHYSRDAEVQRLEHELLAKEVGIGKTVVASEDFMRVEQQLEAARSEAEENARIIGMSAERELALRAKLEAERAESARLVEALEWIKSDAYKVVPLHWDAIAKLQQTLASEALERFRKARGEI